MAHQRRQRGSLVVIKELVQFIHFDDQQLLGRERHGTIHTMKQLDRGTIHTTQRQSSTFESGAVGKARRDLSDLTGLLPWILDRDIK